jgi:uncharacterized protein with PQ loop repeat
MLCLQQLGYGVPQGSQSLSCYNNLCFLLFCYCYSLKISGLDTLLYYVVVIIEHNNLYYVDVPIIFCNPIIKFYNIVLRTIIFKQHIWGAELDVQSQ